MQVRSQFFHDMNLGVETTCLQEEKQNEEDMFQRLSIPSLKFSTESFLSLGAKTSLYPYNKLAQLTPCYDLNELDLFFVPC